MKFTVEKKLKGTLARAGKISTLHGIIDTPAFITVGTKATAKALTPRQLEEIGVQAVLANTYHLYLEPGEKIIKSAGGLGNFMNWNGPTMTDSGGFQVFSLGADFNKKKGKILTRSVDLEVGLQSQARVDEFDAKTPYSEENEDRGRLAKIDEDGVTFKSYKDGGAHRFTPERSIEIQHAIGADIIFAFDECTTPIAPHQYQKRAMERTHRWAARSLLFHKNNKRQPQVLFRIVQGASFEDLRKESARVIGSMNFDGYGIGGSFEKEDMGKAVRFVNELLPLEKPRHLLGIGEPVDLFLAVENGCDTFDCVAPTRMARNGTLYTPNRPLNNPKT